MNKVKETYELLCSTPNDINEHLPTLFKYAQECDSIINAGVKGYNSIWALSYGLLMGNNKDSNKTLLLNDFDECNVESLLTATLLENIKIDCIWKNSLLLEINKVYDLTFIDTWHVYGQLKRELEKFSKVTNKYIIMHDTTVDEWQGETIRLGWNIVQQSLDSGFPIEEISQGVWPAIEEFLKNNPEWVLHERFTNNNGLTILKKCSVHPINFPIPESKIAVQDSIKEKILSSLIPGNLNTYIYKTEEDYYNEYKKSLFALTTKKAGWDCMRHYEIICNGCIPYFPDIKGCPKNTMTFLPKNLIEKGNELYSKCSKYETITNIPNSEINECSNLIKKLKAHLNEYLTTRKMVDYILETSNNNNINSILFLSGNVHPDYLRCLTLHGFKDKFGASCHDFPKIPHMYKYENINCEHLYGMGFTYSKLLDESHRNDELDKSILDDIMSHKYDIIVYGSYHRGMPYYNIVNNYYKPSEIIMICGEDLHECNYAYYVKKGHCVFVREL